jgi:hypothetical protein
MKQNETTYDGLVAVSSAIDNLVDNMDPTNKGGETIGDCFYDIAYQFSRIADSLEKLANK